MFVSTNTNPTKTRLNGKEKYLKLKINILGAKILADMYTATKDLGSYTKLAKYYPKTVNYAGTFVGSVFTPTVSPVWTVDEVKDQYAVFYKASDVTTNYASATGFKEIAKLESTVRKIASNTATAFTVIGAIPAGMDNAIITTQAFFDIGQISNYDFADTTAQIDANDQDTGGYENFINGLKSSTVTATCHYYPKFHTLAQLEYAKLVDAEIEIIHGATDLKYALVYNQTCTITEFTKPAALDGSAKLENSVTFSNSGEVLTQTILVDGTIPDFM